MIIFYENYIDNIVSQYIAYNVETFALYINFNWNICNTTDMILKLYTVSNVDIWILIKSLRRLTSPHRVHILVFKLMLLLSETVCVRIPNRID